MSLHLSRIVIVISASKISPRSKIHAMHYKTVMMERWDFSNQLSIPGSLSLALDAENICFFGCNFSETNMQPSAGSVAAPNRIDRRIKMRGFGERLTLGVSLMALICS